ncbi:MAG: 3-oxoacyl-[acyl-carrier-protein] reductase [Oscillospiraceae bacterium]|jgi:3-oxoacyl-[acyl-carrier protein] reductase|nr:3-oxoacyl-[acyl-carrier-protein] reductase [Oscillospiraceae bacterium]
MVIKMTLEGKTAIVTGASRGIGRAIALRFARAGASVAIIYASDADRADEVRREAAGHGVRAAAYRCDVSDFEAVKNTVNSVCEFFGTIDILVNNAGVTSDGLIVAMKEQSFDRVIGANLKGAFNMIRHCSPVFVRRRSGRILNISSVAGLSGNAGQANYAASKAGLIGLTKTVAREFASRGICCNAIAPGFIATDMTAALDSGKITQSIPLGRAGRPDEVAELALFLCGDGAAYITGEVIRIDGGLAI